MESSDKKNKPFSITKKNLALANLILLLYALFFTLAMCGSFPALSVAFGGGIGDVLWLFLMIGVLIVFFVGFFICILREHVETSWFIALFTMCFVPLAGLHLGAVGGNFNGYQNDRHKEWGLYYDRPKVYFERELAYAKQGDAQYQEHVARYYLTGYGVKQNKTEALKWYRLAAEQGSGYSQYELGMRLLNGVGVEKDSEEAFKWLKKAAQCGNEESRTVLKESGQSWEENDGQMPEN